MQDAGLSLLVAASPTFIAKATPSAPSRSAQLRTMSELLDHGDRALRKAFLESVDGIRDSITLTHITKFLENGDTEGALRYLDRVVPGFFEKVNEARDDLFIKAGKKVASDLREKSPIILTRFDQSNVRAVEMMALNRGQFIREVTESQRNSVYQAMSRGIRDGKNPREVARDFRDAIGLTPRQELAVANYRRGLESNDLSVSLNRALRDHRFDSTVRQAARDSKPLPAPQVDKMVGRYRDRYVKYRAEVVARTEGLRSVNEGAQELWEQVAEGESIIAENEIRRRWSISKDHRVRLWHRLIPALNPDGVRIKEPFRTPKGPLMYPGDPSGTADNTIQCRCVLTFDINLEEDTDDIIVGDFEGVELPDAPPAHATPKKPRKKRTRASAARLPSFPATQSTPDAFDYDADEIDLSKLSGSFAEEKAAWIKQHKAGGSVSDKHIHYWSKPYSVSRYLRQGGNITGENLTKIVDDKMKIAAQPALSEDIKVFRGMDFDDAGLLAIRNQLDSGEFIEKSFMSTTYQRHFGAQWGDNFGRRNLIFEIDVPKGSKGVITGGKDTEYEMTFAPNARFEVIKIKDMKMLRAGAKDGNATVVKLRYLGIDEPVATPVDLRRVAAAKAATKHLLENDGEIVDKSRDYAPRKIIWKGGKIIEYVDETIVGEYSGEQMLFEILKTFEIDDLEKFVPGYKYRLDTAPTHTRRVFHEGLESVDPDFVPTANIKGDDLGNVKNIFHTNGDETLKQLKRGLFDENGHPKDLEITRRRRAEGDKFPAFYRGAKDDSFDEIEMDDIVTSNSQNSRYVAAMRHEFGHYVDRSRVEGNGDGWRGDKEVYEPLEAARAKYAKNRPTDMAGNNYSDVVFAYRSSAYVDEIYDDRADWSIGKKDRAEYEDEFGRRGFHTAGDDETARIANLVKTLDDDLEAAGHKRILKDLVDGSGISEVNLADLKTEDRYDLITSLFRFRDAMVDKNASQLNEAMREFHFVVKSALPDTADNTFHQVHTQFADFFGSMTNNKVGWGHQTEYLKTRTPLKQVFGQDAVGGAISDINTTEMFANYFANRVGSTTANRAYLTMMRHFAPKTAKGFDDIIETRAKKMAGDSYTRPASTISDADKVGDLFAPATPKPRKKRRKKRRSKKKPDLDAAIARPKREYLKEFPEDMDAEDIQYAQRLDLRKVFDDMFAESGISIEEFIMRTLGVNSLGGDDLYMTVRTNDGIIKIRGEQGKNIHKIQRDFLPGGEGVIHNLLHLLPGAQGKGIAKKLMREEIDLYEDLGIKQVNLQANIEGGAYAWARYGFVPTNYGWNGLRSRLRKKLQILYEESTIVTDDVVKRLSTLLSSPDPKVLWKVADFMVGDKKIGKRLLFGDSWHGTLDLNDKESMARFNSYVNPDRDLEAPTQGPVKEKDFFFEETDITFSDRDEHWQKKFERLQTLTNSKVALHHGGFDYTISGPIMRGQKVPKGMSKKEVTRIKSQILADKKQIAAAPAIPFDSKVYRFAGFEGAGKKLIEQQLADGMISDPGFTSTSVKPEFVLLWARQSPTPKGSRYYFEIDVPKGSKGARLQSQFEVDEDDIFQEIELTFAANAKFQVLKVIRPEQSGENGTLVKLRYLSEEKPAHAARPAATTGSVDRNQIRVKFNDYAYDASITTKDINYIRGVINSGDGDAIRELLDYKMEVDGARLGSVLDIDNIDLDAPSIGPVRDITPDTYNYENDILDLKSLEGFEDKEWKSWQRHYKSFGSPDDSHLNFWGPVKYGDMSRFLRGRLSKHPIPDGIAGKIDADRMKIMTTRAVVEDVKVYRGISVGDSQATNFLDRLKTGEFVEKSFMSTSAGRSAATAFLDSDDTGGNFLFEIDVPKGSKGVTAGGNYKKDELEMTFAPNARLEVIKIKENVKMQGGHFSHEGKSVTIVKLRYMGIDETVVKPKPKPKSAAVEEFKQSKDWVRHSEELRERQLKADSTTLDWLKRAYTYMGPYLRGSTIPSFYNRTSTLLPSSISDIQQRVRKDIARIDKAPALGHDMVTYRYVAFDNDTFLKSQLKSGIFRDPAFLSTALKREYIFDWASRAKNQAKHQYMFEIDVPKGSKGVRLASPGSKDGGVAVELTFKPNAEFEILRTSKTTINGKPGTLVKMRYIDDSKVKQPKVVTPKTEPVVEPPQAPKPKKPAQPARMAQKPNERPALLPARALTAEEQIKYRGLLDKYEEKLDKERALGDLKVLDGNDELFTRSMSNDRAINVLKELRLMMKIELGKDAEPKSPNWKKYGGAETMDEMKARHARQLKRGENSADYYEGLQRKYAAEIGGDDLEAPTTGPKREYLKDIPEDVEFTTNEEGINKYDTLFSDSDIGHEEFVLRTLGQNSLRGDGVGMEIKMDDMSDALVVQGGDDVIQTIQRKFGTDGWVEHSIFEIDSEFRGQGIAKKLMREAVDLYVDMDIKGITLQANITHGAYAWARYGFVPTPDEWDYVKGLVRHKFEEYQIGDKAISADDAARLQAILGSDDSKAIWQLADFEAGGEKIGKELLLDDYNVPDETDFDNLQGAYAQRDEIHARMKDKEYEDQDLEGMLDEVESNIEDYKQEYLDNSTAGYLKWNGEFDLHDKESMARFRSYVKPDRDLEAPSTGPKREYLKEFPKDVKFVANKEALGIYNFVFSKEVFPAGNDIGYEEFVMRALGVNSLGGKGIKAELNWNVNDVLQLDATGGNFRKLNREFSPDGTVTHLWLSLNDSAQNRGTSKKLMKEAVDLYEEVGFRKIILEANISHGAYAWARYGFVPNQDDWDSLRYKVLEKLENFGISDAGRKNLFRILNKADPKAIWKLADFEVGGEKIGKELLMDRYGGGDADKKLQVQLSRKSELEFKISGVGATDSDRDKWEELLREVTHDIGNLTRGDDGGRHLSWEGALDLRDKEAMARFHSYVEPRPEGGDAPAVRPAATTGSVDRNQIRVKFNDYAYDASITTKDINYIRGVINDGGDLDALLDYKLEFDGARLGTVLDIDSIDLEAPTTGPKREYLKEFPEDVNAEDVDTRPEFIKTFDEVFPDSDIGHEEFVMRVLGVNSLGGDKMVIRAGAFDGTINVSGGGDDIRRIHRTFWPDGIVDHRNLQLHPDAQGKGIAKKLMREAVDLYEDMGIKRVDLLANIDTGAYAWARYGFAPRERVWFRLRDIINAKFVKWQRVAISEHTPISSDDVARLNKILHSTDPKAIWQLADFEAGGEKIGKELMMGETWPGSLDLNDKEAMARFHAYVNPDRDLEAPTIGPVRDTDDFYDFGRQDKVVPNDGEFLRRHTLRAAIKEHRELRKESTDYFKENAHSKQNKVVGLSHWASTRQSIMSRYLRGSSAKEIVTDLGLRIPASEVLQQAKLWVGVDRSTLESSPRLREDIKVFRNVSFSLDVPNQKAILDKLIPEEFFEDASPMSTTLYWKSADIFGDEAFGNRKRVRFEIDVPKGSRVLIGGLDESFADSELEITIPPNSKFEIIKTADFEKVRIVKMRYIPEEDSIPTTKKVVVKQVADIMTDERTSSKGRKIRKEVDGVTVELSWQNSKAGKFFEATVDGDKEDFYVDSRMSLEGALNEVFEMDDLQKFIKTHKVSDDLDAPDAGPKREYLKEFPEDTNIMGVNSGKVFTKAFKRVFPDSDIDQNEFIMRVLGINSFGGDGLQIGASRLDGGSIEVSARNGKNVQSIRRTFPGGGSVIHNIFELEYGAQGKGIAKKLMREAMDLYADMGINNVELTANIIEGGYAWARYGFVPRVNSWFRFKNEIDSKFRAWQRGEKKIAISSDDAARLQAILDNEDPKAVWELADFEAGGEKIGKELMLGESWHGGIDLNDKESMARFNSYVNPDRDLEAPTQVPVRVEPTEKEVAEKITHLDRVWLDMDRSAYEDTLLKTLAEYRWGKQNMTVLKAGGEFDDYDGQVTLFRGLSDIDRLDNEVENGWTGEGMFGNGTYYSSDPFMALQYSGLQSGGRGYAFPVKLSKEAKVIDYDELGKLHQEYKTATHRSGKAASHILRDEGRYAVSLGYHAIKVKQEVHDTASEGSFFVILDQSKLVTDRDWVAPDARKRLWLSGIDDPAKKYSKFEDELLEIAAKNGDDELQAPSTGPVRDTHPEPTDAEIDAKIEAIDRDIDSLWEKNDLKLEEFARYRWGNQAHELLDGGEFDKIDAPVIYRGVADIRYLDSNIDGSFFGKGVSGNGNYYSSDSETSATYANLGGGYDDPDSASGWLWRSKLRSDAKVILEKDLWEKWKGGRKKYKIEDFNVDMGRYAARLGYDAIKIGFSDSVANFVILNQSKVVVDKRWLPDGEVGRQIKEKIKENRGHSRAIINFVNRLAAPSDLEAPTTVPKREYLKEFPEGVNTLDVDLDYFAESFEELFPGSGVGKKEFVMRTLGINSLGGDGMKIRASYYEGMVIVGGHDGKNIRKIHRLFISGDVVKHEHFELTPDAQGKGIAKKLMKEAVDLYEDMGIKKVTMLANISHGAYAWARYGFVPTLEEWSGLAKDVKWKFRDNQKKGGAIPESDAKRLRKILNGDPKAIWQLADFEAGGEKIGKELLMDKYGQSQRHLMWGGSLDLNDKESMARFHAYVNPDRDLEAPTIGPVREGWKVVRAVGIAEAKEMLIDEPLKELILAAIKHPKNPFSDPSKDIITGKMLDAMTAEEGSELTTDKTKVIHKGGEFIVYQIDEKFE